MPAIANTAFEIKIGDPSRDSDRRVAGIFGSVSDTTFTPDSAPAGYLCVPGALLANTGYEGMGPNDTDILNGNTWQMLVAEDGTSGGRYGDHTGIYACDTHDIPFVEGADGQIYPAGANTLGLPSMKDRPCNFEELMVGEQYKFGKGNFATLPASASAIYCTISDGLWVASASEPAGGTGVYMKILRTEGFEAGTRYAFDGYIGQILRTAEAAE